MEDREQIPMAAENPKPIRRRRTETFKHLYPENNETQSLATQVEPQRQDEPKPRRPVYTTEPEMRRPVDATHYCQPGYNPEQRNEVKKIDETKKEKKRRIGKRTIAGLLATGALIGWIWTSNSDKKEENIPTTTEIATTMPNPTLTPEQFRKELTVTPAPTVVPTAVPQKSKIEISKDNFIAAMQLVEQVYGKDSPEYQFFAKYSITVNPDLPKIEGEITSVEEWFEVAESDPERFRTEGIEFLRRMCLDYSRLVLYNSHKTFCKYTGKTFKIKDPRDIEIKYEMHEDERSIGTFVKSKDGKIILENVGLNLTTQKIDGIPIVCVSNTYYGPGYNRSDTRLDTSDWNHLISICEFHDTIFPKDGTVRPARYSDEQYRDLYLYHMDYYVQEFEEMIDRQMLVDRGDR